MRDLKDMLQTADWKTEKHVPVITLPTTAKKDELISIVATVGKEIVHPNTTEHHIAWLEVYFLPDGDKNPYLIGRFEFNAHGSSAQGPNTSTVYTHPEVSCTLKTGKPGMIYAKSYCNIHGLWTSSTELKLE